MKVLVVHAHPEPRSLNGSLFSFTRDRLARGGHEVETSDLYAMRWKATLDREDFPDRTSDAGHKFDPMADARAAYESGTQAPDVAAEQEKLLRADAVILQFPLWWYTMPAILKGWVDRVYANGFAYGVGEHSDRRWGNRFGEGKLAGKRAMLVVTTGGWASHYGARGIGGPIDDLLFPINHGVLYYPGFAVLPPFLVHRTSRVDAARYAEIEGELGTRLDRLFTDAPIPYRPQNGGDYTIPDLELHEGLSPGRSGFSLHER